MFEGRELGSDAYLMISVPDVKYILCTVKYRFSLKILFFRILTVLKNGMSRVTLVSNTFVFMRVGHLYCSVVHSIRMVLYLINVKACTIKTNTLDTSDPVSYTHLDVYKRQ